jgi:hypothetical protein
MGSVRVIRKPPRNPYLENPLRKVKEKFAGPRAGDGPDTQLGRSVVVCYGDRGIITAGV